MISNHSLSIINYYNRIKNLIYVKGLYPRFKYFQKYEPEQIKICDIEQFQILNNSPENDNIISEKKTDNIIDKRNFNTSEKLDVNPQK